MASRSAKPLTFRALSIAPIGATDPPPVLYELLGDSTEIGSADDNAIVLAHPTVAPHHMAVRRAGGREHLLVDVAERRRHRDLEWTRFKAGDAYWCPRHGSLEHLNAHGLCPRCRRKQGSLWLLRPLTPGDSFKIGKAFRATLVVQERIPVSTSPLNHAGRSFPPSELFEPEAPPSKVSLVESGLTIPQGRLPTDDSNLWQWQPKVAPFPIFLHQRVNRMITQHARENSQCEVGGILLGDVRQEEGQLFVIITHSLKAEFATETHGHLTFTQKTWLKIHQMHDAQYPDKTIVGWYHTHPGWTIFLSDWDLFIHRNFFKQPWQIALVLDPSLDRAGFFVWKGDTLLDPQRPVEPFQLFELDGWQVSRPSVRIKLLE
jgi:proteasome lid subunit RPN8/RPN11